MGAQGADDSPAAAQLEQDAGTYVKAMVSGAPRETVDSLHARFVLTQRLSARMGARDLVTDRAWELVTEEVCDARHNGLDLVYS